MGVNYSQAISGSIPFGDEIPTAILMFSLMHDSTSHRVSFSEKLKIAEEKQEEIAKRLMWQLDVKVKY
jgi:hypothetical protein